MEFDLLNGIEFNRWEWQFNKVDGLEDGTKPFLIGSDLGQVNVQRKVDLTVTNQVGQSVSILIELRVVVSTDHTICPKSDGHIQPSRELTFFLQKRMNVG